MSQKYIGGFVGSATSSGYSALFNGASGSYLSLAGASQYAIATSTTPFTIEFWIRPTSSGGVVFTEQFTGSSNTIAITCSLAAAAAVEVIPGLSPAFGWFNGTTWVTAAASTTALVLNAWSHVAFVFTGATSRVYINGFNVTKASAPTPATTWGVTGVSGDSWYMSKNWQTATTYTNGNISNFRFVNGTAVYTSNFTPPLGLAPIPNTALLICQSPTFIDNSIYNATITNNGSVLISDNNPFPLSGIYSPQLGAATMGVWTLNQAATATAQRTWPMFDPEFNITTGVVHGTGTNGGTNNTFLDSSSNGFAVTRNGNTTQGTFTPFSKPAGYWSNYFDGVGDYLSVADNAALQFGTGNFTVEFFANIQAAPGTFRFCVSKGATATGWAVFVDNTLGYWSFAETANNYISAVRCVFNQWTHLALVRSGTSMILYVDGIAATSITSSTNFNQTEQLLIGLARNLTAPVLGCISNLRILKGQALYTSNFTPPTTPLQKIPNTSLLTCLNNRFIDISDNGFTITQNGGVGVVEFSPFYSSAYSPTVNGGGMFFDGGGDYLTVADNPTLELGSSDFCVEMLIYTTAVATDAILITKRASSVDYAPILIWRNGAIIKAALSSTGSSWDIANNITLGTVTTNQWYHISVYRVGTAIYGSFNETITTLNASTSASLLNNSAPYYIGSDSNLSPYVGHISNLRIVIGSPVYSGSSAPIPTAPFTPTSSANTQLLLSGTNAAIFDNASNITIETVDTSISTAQSNYGSGSIAFNGTSAYAKLISPLNTSINLLPTLGNFTIEAWINPTSVAVAKNIFYIGGNTISYASVRVDHTATGALQLLVSTTGAAWAINITSTRLLTAGVWSHIAVVRAGVNIALYLNGVLAASSGAVTVATSLLAQPNNFLGAFFNSTIQGFFNGYMSDFRMTNHARYLGNFTPPTSTLQNQ